MTNYVEGWVMVPKEPTEAMRQAMYMAQHYDMSVQNPDEWGAVDKSYAAMLAAAPQPQPPINSAETCSKSIDSPAHGDGEVRIGETRCYGDDAWFRELTVQGVTFLAPLDDQDRARHILARPAPEAQEAMDAVEVVQIPRSKSLDPITVYLTDLGNGAGRATIVCYNQAWTCFWGSMGCGLRDFIRSCDKHYVAGNMVSGRARVLHHERDYAERIAQAVIAALALPAQGEGEGGEPEDESGAEPDGIGSYPSDGAWVQWSGGSCPVPTEVRVEYRLRDGHGGDELSGDLNWLHEQPDKLHRAKEIVKYRTLAVIDAAITHIENPAAVHLPNARALREVRDQLARPTQPSVDSEDAALLDCLHEIRTREERSEIDAQDVPTRTMYRQRVVALDAAIGALVKPSGWAMVLSNHASVKRFYADRSICGEPVMIESEGAGFVRHSDYAALLQQLAEREAEVESTLACNRGLVRLNEAVTARAESAERAREEATGLLREVEPEINELSNIYYSEFSNTKREKETEALHSRIAAFLAASGGGRED